VRRDFKIAIIFAIATIGELGGALVIGQGARIVGRRASI
jgi:hypothetical protein